MKQLFIKIAKVILSWIYFLVLLLTFVIAVYLFLFLLVHVSIQAGKVFGSGPQISMYISSILAILILLFLSSNKIDDKVSRYINNKKCKDNFFKRECRTFIFFLRVALLLPKRTIIFSVYILILLYNQINSIYPSFTLSNIVNQDIYSFIQSSEYSIILLIAFDRLLINFEKEKSRFKSHLIQLLSKTIN